MVAMPYRNLTDFLEELGQSGEITRIEAPTAPVLQLAEIVARHPTSGDPAYLFSAVLGHDMPVLANLLATEPRICRALGIASLEEAVERVSRLLETSTPESWFERLKCGSHSDAVSSVSPRKVKAAAVQQIVRLGSDIDLNELPLLQVVEGEAGPAITSAVVLTAEPDSHRSVFGRFDLQRLDHSRLAVCWSDQDEHARLLGEYRARTQKMPLAVVLGGDPAFMLAASAPLPPNTDVCAVAGLLRGKPLDIVACRGVDLNVPAEAEIILEGHVDPAQPPVTAGPLCGLTGHLTRPRPVPVMQVTALTHRANPVYAAMVPGRPPHEACVMARAMQRVFLPLARLAMPELVNYDLPEFGAARHWAAVSIRKSYAGQSRRAIHAAWNLPALQFAKVLVMVDADVDVSDQRQVSAAITAHMRPGRDIVVEQGPADPFDPVASGSLGEKMAIDATRKLPEEDTRS